VDTTIILVLDRRNPSPREWSTWVEAYCGAVLEHGVRRLLVVSRGGGPNARQRKELIAGVVTAVGAAAEDISTAVCGSSPIVRAITAAFGWLSGAPRMKSFGSEARREALAFLKVPELAHPEILATVRHFQAELQANAPPSGSPNDE
jgi:hypothetical protein